MDTTRRHSWMWAEACALLEQAERKHRHFFDLIGAPSRAGRGNHRPIFSWTAPKCTWWWQLPGARVDAGDRAAKRDRLADRRDGIAPCIRRCREIVRLEIPYGRMRRRIELPAGRYALTERSLDHGYLQLHLTRRIA